MKTPPRELRSSHTWRRRRIWLYAFLLVLVALAYATMVEPFWIQVTHSTLTGNVRTPLKIAHLSDLHTQGLGLRERRLLKILDQEKPDIIVITGDTLSGSKAYRRERELLPQLHAPLGVWLVRGNWENSYPRAEERKFYSDLGVHLLVNQGSEVRDDVWLMGLDDPTSGNPDLDAALQNDPPGEYRIALFHSPFFFTETAGRYDLALAGHSHGGQVRIPFLYPYWVPPGVGHYVEGWFEKNGSRLYVSRGIGTTFLPIRFLCRPEISVVTVNPAGKPPENSTPN